MGKGDVRRESQVSRAQYAANYAQSFPIPIQPPVTLTVSATAFHPTHGIDESGVVLFGSTEWAPDPQNPGYEWRNVGKYVCEHRPILAPVARCTRELREILEQSEALEGAPVGAIINLTEQSWPPCYNLSGTGNLHPSATPPCNGDRCTRCVR